MRQRIFEIIEASKEDDKLSSSYDMIMLLAIIISLIPLAFKETNTVFIVIDKVTVTLFIIDYLLRLITADYKLQTKSPIAFIKYPFGFMAMVDLISILPSLNLMNSAFRLFKVFRMLRVARVFRTARIFRVFKAARYSKSIMIIMEVFRQSKDALLAVGTLAVVYILISALIVFNVEPETFPSFFDAIYWATISLTTVGYGDVYCVSTFGKIITMLSSIAGIAIVALPAGIVTGGYLDALNKADE